MKMVHVEEISVVGTHTLLEGPHWVAASQSLFFVDIMKGRIFRFDYPNNQIYEASIDGETDTKIGFITPLEGKSDEFVIGAGPRLLLIQWDGKSKTAQKIRTYVEVDQNVGQTRFNDGKADPHGRIFAGTMKSEEPITDRKGTFFRIVDGVATALKGNINISNGLAWNEKTNKFYYIDSGDLNLKEYDYETSTGEISNERIVLEIPKDTYVLDGMTIDEDGMLYIATFFGGRVIKVDPNEKKIVDEYLIPNAKQITSVAFGGPNFDELFVTTAAFEQLPGPNGKLFKITGLGKKGTEMYTAKI